MQYYLFEGSKLLVRNNRFQWLNSDATSLHTLTSVLLTINHQLAVTGKGAGNEDAVDVVVNFTREGFFCLGICGMQVTQ